MIRTIDSRRDAVSFVTMAVETSATMMLITPEIAADFLQRFHFPGQRAIRPLRVSTLVYQMQHGQWLRMELDLVRVRRGNLYLMNGYHRLTALIQAGISINATVTVHVVDDDAEVGRFYSTFDTGRVRNLYDSIVATGFTEQVGLTSHDIGKIKPAIAMMVDGFVWRFNKTSTQFSFAQFQELINEWGPEAREYVRLIGKASGVKPLYRAAVVAVGLITLRYQPHKARAFWASVGADDGLKAGTPEHTLLRFLRDERTFNTNDRRAYAYSVAVAWNAYYRDRSLQFIRVVAASLDRPILIEGTPYDGKHYQNIVPPEWE